MIVVVSMFHQTTVLYQMFGSKWQDICFSGYILGACYIQMCMTLERFFNSEELNGLHLNNS